MEHTEQHPAPETWAAAPGSATGEQQATGVETRYWQVETLPYRSPAWAFSAAIPEKVEALRWFAELKQEGRTVRCLEVVKVVRTSITRTVLSETPNVSELSDDRREPATRGRSLE